VQSGTQGSSTQTVYDGQKLAELMIDHNLGVSPMATHEVKRIDADYFTEWGESRHNPPLEQVGSPKRRSDYEARRAEPTRTRRTTTSRDSTRRPSSSMPVR